MAKERIQSTTYDRKTLQNIATELGPFSPPPDYTFEPEFQAAIPRPIPKAFRNGLHEQRWRTGLTSGLMVGTIFLLLSTFQFVRDLGYYILPLAYLDWAGWGTLAGTILAGIYHSAVTGRKIYVKQGQPIIVRVLAVDPYVRAMGEGRVFGFMTAIEYYRTDKNEIDYAMIPSGDVGNAILMKRYGVSIKPGDYVTAVSLPEKFLKSLRLYGFLGLNPDVNFLLKNDKKIEQHFSLSKTIGIVLGVMALFTLILFGTYSFGYSGPTEGSWVILGSAAGLGILAGFAIAMAIKRSYRRRGIPMPWSGPLLVFSCMVAIGRDLRVWHGSAKCRS